MTNIILTLIWAIGLFGGSQVLCQTSYSESTPYKPRPSSQKEKKKQSNASPPATQAAAVPGNETITIPISVFDNSGAFVNGVMRSDVDVSVDGVEVPIVSFAKDTEPPNVILLLDISPSNYFDTMQEQAMELVRALPPNAKVMLIEFDSDVYIRSQLTSDRTEIEKKMAKRSGSGTALYNALETVFRKVLPQLSGRNCIVLMTDGVDTVSKKSKYASSLEDMERADVSIYTVYYDTQKSMIKSVPNNWLADLPGSSDSEYETGRSYLQDLAAVSGGRIFMSEAFDSGLNSLVSELSAKYYATIAVPKTRAGRYELIVRIKRPALAVFARGSFIQNL